MVYPLTSENFRYQEFQERVWQDVVRNSPAYILVVNIPTSTLWDGRADLKIVQRLKELIRNRYQLEAVMPVHEPVGHLTILTEGEVPGIELTGNRPNIYVYRLTVTP